MGSIAIIPNGHGVLKVRAELGVLEYFLMVCARSVTLLAVILKLKSSMLLAKYCMRSLHRKKNLK